MGLREKTREELLELAKDFDLNVPHNITNTVLQDRIERAAIAKTVAREEEVRAELQAKAKLRQDIAEIKATAELEGYAIEVPDNPTAEDIIKLRRQIGLKKAEPKPSPETVAIEKSKRVYAIFHNLEQDDLDIRCNPGGKYRFHFWPNRVHVIPQCLIKIFADRCVNPIYERQRDPNTGEVVSKRVGTKRRFMFEVLGQADDNASFGVVLDDKTLKKIKEQPVDS